ncbi:hypothetical protein [Cytobacillus massiliigabonensis]|uniref:hypothetical protein n=1 Tax=Cytobacillus massiliigabonensis TaxID=1871011 RepID=UPI000C829361|nr:hypothetical protein [Cytobacillus massiliigabonensis]
METALNIINSLIQFKNQQVIINFYEEDELIQREGLFFESIQIVDYQVQFSKGGIIVFSLSFEGYMKFSQRTEFKNYYSLEKDSQRVELYFT